MNIESVLPAAFDLNIAFSPGTLGEALSEAAEELAPKKRRNPASVSCVFWDSTARRLMLRKKLSVDAVLSRARRTLSWSITPSSTAPTNAVGPVRAISNRWDPSR